MNPPTVGGKFAAKDVGGAASPTPRGGVKTPPYDAKDKGDTMARLRAGHARPPTDYCERVAHERGARVAASPVQPHKNKKTRRPLPRLVFS